MDGNELGTFLRARREAVSPAELGLPVGPRRRTPGLRRSEVATLAGVSVEYVTRLEQGRDRHPSPAVLSTLADVLGLTPRERVHLYRLSKGTTAGFTCRGGAAPTSALRPALRALLERLEPTAAVVLNRVTDVVACTVAFERLARPTGLLDGWRGPGDRGGAGAASGVGAASGAGVAGGVGDVGEVPNVARFVFTDSRARSVLPDWSRAADEMVAALKQGPFRADRYVAALADELTLTAGAAFGARITALTGLPAASGIVRLSHPTAGPLNLAVETLELPADDDLRILVGLPADAVTSAALDGRHEPLRVISGGAGRKVRPA
ncbi:helix-turn-helix domain-containing protein [Parafrankia sp. EUN1f]|uniref:helix-turn-helix domain-containing protein n=1 Tax=Parafrankia sp. EUN1f TaxID=102897 RepID=UPI0001C46C23|nr:helix-turn-helix transcriptional regulator [Parafrankia sp. EUN1f]EFC80721.1 transcriptional regulator, XRE family [Parafrankia sp. EUN1f]